MWEAAEVDGRIGRACDPENGALMIRKSTAEIETNEIIAQIPDAPKLSFHVSYEPKLGSFSGNDPKNPMIKLLVGEFLTLVRKQKPGAFEENTQLVRYLINGVAAINRRWPSCGSPYFYSDLHEYESKGIAITEFDFPSDEELAQL